MYSLVGSYPAAVDIVCFHLPPGVHAVFFRNVYPAV